MDWAIAIPVGITVVTIVGYFVAMRYYPEWVGISKSEAPPKDDSPRK